MHQRIRIVRRARLAAVAALTVGLTASGALADGPIKQRQENQDARIEQGADSGALTGKEQKKLEKQQDAIDDARDQALANDGKIGAREARGLTAAQDAASGQIRRLKSNDRTDPPAE